jgi:hypothetical protein
MRTYPTTEAHPATTTAARMRHLGLEVPVSTQLAEQHHVQEQAQANVDRALARAQRLEHRAQRKPLNSNGRRRDERDAHHLRAEAERLAEMAGLQHG